MMASFRSRMHKKCTSKSDMSMYRSTIDMEKRKKAMERRLRHGKNTKTHFQKLDQRHHFYRRRRRAQATAQFRNAYHAPYKVLKRLREGITMKNIIKTFKLMDVGNSGVGPYQSKYEKEAEELEQKDEIRINIGDKKAPSLA